MAHVGALGRWAQGGDVSPGHPRVPQLPPEGSAPPGAVPAGDGSGAKLRMETPQVSGGSLLNLALIRKKSSPVLFQIWKRALQLSLDLGLGFRAASLQACHLRAKREPGGGFGVSRKGRKAPRYPGASVGLGASLDELLQSGWSSARAGSAYSLRQRSRACRGGTGEISSPLAARPWARGCSSRQLGAAASEASYPRPPSARACVLVLVHPEASAQIFGNLPCVLGLPRAGAGLCPSRPARVTRSVVLFLNSVVTSCVSLEPRGEGSRSGCERAVQCFTCARSHQTTP